MGGKGGLNDPGVDPRPKPRPCPWPSPCIVAGPVG